MSGSRAPRWVGVTVVAIAAGCSPQETTTTDLNMTLWQSEPPPATHAGGAVSLEVSKVTKRTLEVQGLSTADSIAAWFNEPLPKSDPFAPAMEAEIRTAQSSAADATSLEDLKLSPPTIAVLGTLGIQSAAQLIGFDPAKLSDLRRAEEVCRPEIVKAMRGLGWTLITADVTNRPRASQLTVNGQVLGRLAASDSPVSRQFLTWIAGSLWDQSKIATLSVEIPDSSTGRPPVRWYRDIELRRGGEQRIAIDVLSAPIPSIGFKPSRLASPAAVYAGDQVELFVEGGAEDTIWLVMPNPAELRGDNYRTSPSDSDATAGLPSWLQLREIVRNDGAARSSVLAGNEDPLRQIGRGVRLTWQPQYESNSAMVIAVVKGPGGFWGMATRDIAVADIRPGLWVMPRLPLASTPGFLGSLDRAIPLGSSLNIYLTHWVLSQLTYRAETGQEVDFEIRVDDLLEASLALSRTTVDFGDGTPPVVLQGGEAIRATLSHRYSDSGRYVVTLVTEDIMGLQRTQSTNIQVDPTPAPEPAPAATTVVMPPMLAPAERTARAANTPTTFDLLRRAVELWSSSVAEIAADVVDDRSLAIAHLHEQYSRSFLDLIDSGLVSALLDEDLTVIEREPFFQSVIDARGLLVAETFEPRPQGTETGEVLLEVAKLFPAFENQLVQRWIDGLDDPANPESNLVLDYKLKRAEVRVQELGDIAVRTARLMAVVRIHDRVTYQVLSNDIIESEVSDTIPRGEVAALGGTWDSFPDGFMTIRED